jgi:hypothetical protein
LRICERLFQHVATPSDADHATHSGVPFERVQRTLGDLTRGLIAQLEQQLLAVAHEHAEPKLVAQ